MSNWEDLKNNPRLKKVYEDRIKIIRLIREFFSSAGFDEVDTPTAIKLAGQEPYLNPVPLVFHHPFGQMEKFYLRTSPEYALKKLLAVGFNKIFEIAKVFRDYEEFGKTHNPEFTMIEWYRAPGSLENIMDDTEQLFKYVAKNLDPYLQIPSIISPLLGERQREGLSMAELFYKDKKIKIMENWERMEMKTAWEKYAKVNLDDYLTLEEMRILVKNKGYQVSPADAYEDLFFKIFLNEIEPHLGSDVPTIVYNYPAQMCSLSKLCVADKRYAERFELYVGGLELANAFGELTDAEEQKKRLEADKKLRADLGKETWSVDGDFIHALAGLPTEAQQSMAGIALGVDRMVLLFTGAKDINEVIFQSVADQVGN